MVSKKFPTLYAPRSRSERVRTCCGDPVQITYQLKYGDDGKKDLYPVGKLNLYDEIQSWRGSCELKTLLERYQNGDTTALSHGSPIFGDFSAAPKSLAEYYQRISEAEAAFNRLSVDVRAQFNHSPSEFFASIGTERFNEVLGIRPAPVVGDVSSERHSVPASEKEGESK